MNYVEDQTQSSTCKFDDILEHYAADVGEKGNKQLSHCISAAFGNVGRKTMRNATDWTSRSVYFLGLKKRNRPEALPFTDILNYVPKDFIVSKHEDGLISLMYDTGLKSNDIKIYLDITIMSDGSFEVFLGQKNINAAFGTNCLKITVDAVLGLLSFIRTLKFCSGRTVENEKNLAVHEKENCTTLVNEKNQITLFSVACTKVLPPYSMKTTSLCKNCSSLTLNASFSNNDKNCLKTNEADATNDVCKENSPQQLNPKEIIEKLKEGASYLSENQLSFISSQLETTSEADIHSRRWNSDMIQLGMTIWTRSPHTYNELLNSGYLILPSVKTLARYKNEIRPKSGINEEVMKWMYMQACHDKLSPEGHYGGLVFDEMAIQPDIEIVHGKSPEMIGFAAGSNKLADHVIQFVFHGLTGFWFLVAHYPTVQASAADIYVMFWDVVKALEMWGFHVLYACMDGASNNRRFMKMHCDVSKTEPTRGLSADNHFCDHPIFFLSDPSHLFKKIRNNILKSGKEKYHTRLLKHTGSEITWNMFTEVYEWDKKHGLSIHNKLTNGHFHLNQADKMRNHLAEEVLDSDMLHLMQVYKNSLGENGLKLEGTVTLLKQTSSLVSIFKDRRPVSDTADSRLEALCAANKWFAEWEAANQVHNLMSKETREDIHILIYGFVELVKFVTMKLKHMVVPLYINSDIIENVFSQQRGLHHGSNSNPNYMQYGYAVNSITLGQKTISKKANAARRKSTSNAQGALPFKILRKSLRL